MPLISGIMAEGRRFAGRPARHKTVGALIDLPIHMIERHPNLRTITVPDQGHAPLLKDHDTVEAIASFFAAND